jgi:hypothetical protein
MFTHSIPTSNETSQNIYNGRSCNDVQEKLGYLFRKPN